jgi:hypothetical protein
MIQIKLYKSPWKALRLLILATPFVGGGIWMVLCDSNSNWEKFWGWIAFIFFGSGYTIGFYHLFDRRPQIIIDENGIWDRTTNQDKIKWRQIRKVYAVSIHGQKFISLKVDKTFIWKKEVYGWAKRINKSIGAQDLNLSLSQLKIDEKEFESFVRKMSKIHPTYYPQTIESFLQGMKGKF